MASVARLAATDAGVPRATIKLDGQCHQFGSEAGVSLRLAGCEAVDHLEILPLDVPQIAQTLLQAVDWGPPLVRENTDAPHRPDLLLRPRREGPTRRASEQRDELAPPHSITSSASESKLSEIVTLSSLAVFMLITSSNLTTCCTGKSAGFAPLRILAV